MSGHWQPGCDLRTARQRASMLAAARSYFAQRDVLEVETPMLSSAAVSDVNIDSISAQVSVLRQQQFLHTSPEYAMKRLLCGGYPDCYQICRVFRDGECGIRHQPEFTMLEWYRLGFDLDAIVEDTVQLVQALLTNTQANDVTLQPARCQRFDEALHAACGLDSESTLDALTAAAGDGFPEALRDDKDALLDFLFDDRVARAMPDDALTVITHYPASQAALAQIDRHSDRALRFEVYGGGIELANGFVELRDAAEQRRRFEADQRAREQAGKSRRPIDEQFLAALESGLPACAGVAVGFDRLVMLACGKRDIREVLSFAHHSGTENP